MYDLFIHALYNFLYSSSSSTLLPMCNNKSWYGTFILSLIHPSWKLHACKKHAHLKKNELLQVWPGGGGGGGGGGNFNFNVG